MEVININSYYFSSSLYMPMEDSIINRVTNIRTYVPVNNNYKIRKEINMQPSKHVNVSKVYSKNDRFIFHLKHNKIKRDFFKEYNLNPNITLHAHSLFSNGYIAYSSYKKFKTPYVVAVRSTDMNVFFKKLIYLRPLGLRILINAKKIIFLSIPYMEKCIKKYVPQKYQSEIRNKSIVVPNGIDNFWFENKLLIPKKISSNKLCIIFVGDDSKRKNLLRLIEACDLLNKNKLSLKLIIVGQINDKKLKHLINERSFIDYKGYLEKHELIKQYRASDLFVLPSLTETFGLVYPEAMSQGLPIIYTQDQGFDGQFDQGVVGYAVDSTSVEDIVEKIIAVKKNYNKLSKNVLKFVDKYNWNKIGDTYKRIYINTKE